MRLRRRGQKDSVHVSSRKHLIKGRGHRYIRNACRNFRGALVRFVLYQNHPTIVDLTERLQQN
jgi:hypothetical protein